MSRQGGDKVPSIKITKQGAKYIATYGGVIVGSRKGYDTKQQAWEAVKHLSKGRVRANWP